MSKKKTTDFVETKGVIGFTNNKDYQTIYLDIYKENIDICVGNKELFQTNYKDAKLSGEYGAITVKNKEGRIGLLFPEKKDVRYDHIAHEIVHIVDFIYENIGDEHCPTHPEPTAYLHGYLMKRILDVMKDFKIKIK